MPSSVLADARLRPTAVALPSQGLHDVRVRRVSSGGDDPSPSQQAGPDTASASRALPGTHPSPPAAGVATHPTPAQQPPANGVGHLPQTARAVATSSGASPDTAGFKQPDQQLDPASVRCTACGSQYSRHAKPGARNGFFRHPSRAWTCHVCCTANAVHYGFYGPPGTRSLDDAGGRQCAGCSRTSSVNWRPHRTLLGCYECKFGCDSRFPVSRPRPGRKRRRPPSANGNAGGGRASGGGDGGSGGKSAAEEGEGEEGDGEGDEGEEEDGEGEGEDGGAEDGPAAVPTARAAAATASDEAIARFATAAGLKLEDLTDGQPPTGPVTAAALAAAVRNYQRRLTAAGAAEGDPTAAAELEGFIASTLARQRQPGAAANGAAAATAAAAASVGGDADVDMDDGGEEGAFAGDEDGLAEDCGDDGGDVEGEVSAGTVAAEASRHYNLMGVPPLDPTNLKCLACGTPFVQNTGRPSGFFTQPGRDFTCHSCCLKNQKARGFYGPPGTRSLAETGGRQCAVCGACATPGWRSHALCLGLYACKACDMYRRRHGSYPYPPAAAMAEGAEGADGAEAPPPPPPSRPLSKGQRHPASLDPASVRCATCEAPYKAAKPGARNGFFQHPTRAWTCDGCCHKNYLSRGFYGPPGTRSLDDAGGRECANCASRRSEGWRPHKLLLGSYACKPSCELRTGNLPQPGPPGGGELRPPVGEAAATLAIAASVKRERRGGAGGGGAGGGDGGERAQGDGEHEGQHGADSSAEKVGGARVGEGAAGGGGEKGGCEAGRDGEREHAEEGPARPEPGIFPWPPVPPPPPPPLDPKSIACVTCTAPYRMPKPGVPNGFFSHPSRAFTCDSCCRKNRIHKGFYGPPGTRSLEQAGGRECVACGATQSAGWRPHKLLLGSYACKPGCEFRVPGGGSGGGDGETASQQPSGGGPGDGEASPTTTASAAGAASPSATATATAATPTPAAAATAPPRPPPPRPPPPLPIGDHPEEEKPRPPPRVAPPRKAAAGVAAAVAAAAGLDGKPRAAKPKPDDPAAADGSTDDGAANPASGNVSPTAASQPPTVLIHRKGSGMGAPPGPRSGPSLNGSGTGPQVAARQALLSDRDAQAHRAGFPGGAQGQGQAAAQAYAKPRTMPVPSPPQPGRPQPQLGPAAAALLATKAKKAGVRECVECLSRRSELWRPHPTEPHEFLCLACCKRMRQTDSAKGGPVGASGKAGGGGGGGGRSRRATPDPLAAFAVAGLEALAAAAAEAEAVEAAAVREESMGGDGGDTGSDDGGGSDEDEEGGEGRGRGRAEGPMGRGMRRRMPSQVLLESEATQKPKRRRLASTGGGAGAGAGGDASPEPRDVALAAAALEQAGGAAGGGGGRWRARTASQERDPYGGVRRRSGGSAGGAAGDWDGAGDGAGSGSEDDVMDGDDWEEGARRSGDGGRGRAGARARRYGEPLRASAVRCVSCGGPYATRTGQPIGCFDASRAYTCHACCQRNARSHGYYGPIGTRSLEEAGGRECAECGCRESNLWKLHKYEIGLYVCAVCYRRHKRHGTYANGPGRGASHANGHRSLYGSGGGGGGGAGTAPGSAAMSDMDGTHDDEDGDAEGDEESPNGADGTASDRAGGDEGAAKAAEEEEDDDDDLAAKAGLPRRWPWEVRAAVRQRRRAPGVLAGAGPGARYRTGSETPLEVLILTAPRRPRSGAVGPISTAAAAAAAAVAAPASAAPSGAWADGARALLSAMGFPSVFGSDAHAPESSAYGTGLYGSAYGTAMPYAHVNGDLDDSGAKRLRLTAGGGVAPVEAIEAEVWVEALEESIVMACEALAMAAQGVEPSQHQARARRLGDTINRWLMSHVLRCPLSLLLGPPAAAMGLDREGPLPGLSAEQQASWDRGRARVCSQWAQVAEEALRAKPKAPSSADKGLAAAAAAAGPALETAASLPNGGAAGAGAGAAVACGGGVRSAVTPAAVERFRCVVSELAERLVAHLTEPDGAVDGGGGSVAGGGGGPARYKSLLAAAAGAGLRLALRVGAAGAGTAGSSGQAVLRIPGPAAAPPPVVGPGAAVASAAAAPVVVIERLPLAADGGGGRSRSRMWAVAPGVSWRRAGARGGVHETPITSARVVARGG
ncbi:hypothetical protein HYH03_003485 [Edaphochlamys debaryana]|uniref:GATA-type domain-containing protein n=1 Tax=Edaphochlamys debaryana TaxID=47281 RepID=A0A836C353_9CHLO|nr:hypothetical protein HYH03_003485 [Edaphochlamys debaryana]|eukprot:KAG2498746.1 hypothetical protein HYH03_003485 [Edaphochlamys debaryana]